MEELARRAGVAVDTLRYYQSRGLLPPPRREGRVAWYGPHHLERLGRIRELAGQGFKLAQIERLLAAPEGDGDLLQALVAEHVGGRMLSSAELAAESGLPEALLAGAASAGLIQPVKVGGEDRYTEADLELARGALALLDQGLPLAELLALARDHAAHVDAVVGRAIALFGEHVRKDEEGRPRDPGQVTEAFRTLLPRVTQLVAVHFQRTLLARALERLADPEQDAELYSMLGGSSPAQIDVKVAWR